MKEIVPDFQSFKRLSIHQGARERNVLRSIFKEVDDDESGELDHDEARIFFEKVNLDRKNRGEAVLSLTDDNFDRLFIEADEDNSGLIDFNEVMVIMDKIKKGALQDIMSKQFTNMISMSKRSKTTSMTALKYIEDTYDASKNLDAINAVFKKFPELVKPHLLILNDPSYFPSVEDIQDLHDFFEIFDSKLDFITTDLLLAWIYSSRSSVKEIMRLRAAIIKVVEENRNSAESEHCTIVCTKIKRGKQIISLCNGDWDALCFENDRIVYDLAICDTDGVLLEKPSARTKIAVEITSEDVKSFTGKMQPIVSHLSPIVQFHNIREQEGKSQHNASVEFSIPRTKKFQQQSNF